MSTMADQSGFLSSGERLARAVLLFHADGEWTRERRVEWRELTGSDSATTRTLCDHARRVQADEERRNGDHPRQAS